MIFVQTKKGLVGLGQEGFGGGYLKRGGTEKRGGDTKFLKRMGQAGSRGGCLKKRDWKPLTNYGLQM